MTNWQSVSELTPEIVEAAWRLIVWDGRDSFTLREYVSDDVFELDKFNGEWCVHIPGYTERYPVKHFAIINAPPGAE